MNLTPSETLCLNSLRAEIEGYEHDDQAWGSVYLDNAIPVGMPAKTWRAVLSSLAKKGLYRVDDGWAFGYVKMDD